MSNHQILGSRQISNGSSQLQLTAQQQQMLLQQQNSHLLNGFKLPSADPQNLKSVTQQQNVSSSGLEDHIDNPMLNTLSMNINNMNLTSNNNANVANSFTQLSHLNDLSSTGQNSSSNSTMHVDHPNLFVKNNVSMVTCLFSVLL